MSAKYGEIPFEPDPSGIYIAPAGTPIPTDVDSALEGFVEIGTVSPTPSFGIDPETLREFVEQNTGRPYAWPHIWPRQNGKNSLFVRFAEALDVLIEGFRPVGEAISTTFRETREQLGMWSIFFGDLSPAERSPRSARRRKNRLRRKRIARKRRRG